MFWKTLPTQPSSSPIKLMDTLLHMTMEAVLATLFRNEIIYAVCFFFLSATQHSVRLQILEYYFYIFFVHIYGFVRESI